MSLIWGDWFPVLKAIREDSQCQGLHTSKSLLATPAVYHDPGKIGHFGHPAAIVFLFYVNHIAHSWIIPWGKSGPNAIFRRLPHFGSWQTQFPTASRCLIPGSLGTITRLRRFRGRRRVALAACCQGFCLTRHGRTSRPWHPCVVDPLRVQRSERFDQVRSKLRRLPVAAGGAAGGASWERPARGPPSAWAGRHWPVEWPGLPWGRRYRR